MSDTHAMLSRVLDTFHSNMSEEDQDAMQDLIEIYKPYKGDRPEEASKRTLANAKCENCTYTFPVMSMPAEVGKTARSAMRHAACPRCFSNIDIMLGN
jgi:hypothetical protein